MIVNSNHHPLLQKHRKTKLRKTTKAIDKTTSFFPKTFKRDRERVFTN